MNAVKKTYSTYFHTYYRPLCLYALRFMENTDAAEDVVQDTFTALWEKRETMHQISSVKSYLFAAVRNNCLMKLRNKQNFDNVEELQMAEEISEDERIARAELEARLWEMMDRLPERQREILLMAKRDGMSYKEISAETGISVKTIETHIARALQSLRKKDFRIYSFFFM